MKATDKSEDEPFTLTQQIGAASLWDMYEHGLRERNRHVPFEQSYFDELFEGCIRCEVELPTQSVIYRGRVMPPDKATDTEPLPIDQMGPPPPERTPDGRVNPSGIPCFYGALEMETVRAELRPWPLARLTIARFVTQRPLRVLDLRQTNPVVRTTVSVYWCAYMISRPVHHEDRFRYLGTQYLAEKLKAAGVDGLLYGSLLQREGTNVALFHYSDLKDGTVSFHMVLDVAYESVNLSE